MKAIYGLIGHPIGHSMSPMMHNDQFKQQGIEGYYHAFDVLPEQLENAVNGMKALGVAGFNVTIPHKVNVMRFLDEVDEEAAQIGAVNTVVHVNGKLIGYNTDGKGFLRSLQKVAGADFTNRKILIIGAGGAARAIYVTLVRCGANYISIANRTMKKAETLIQTTPFSIHSNVLSIMEAEKNLHLYDIIINTTSVGMSPKIDEMPLNLINIKQNTILSDIIYNPLQTKWLRVGKDLGAITQNGVGMFVWQGAFAFELWTNKKADVKRMEQMVIRHLGGNK